MSSRRIEDLDPRIQDYVKALLDEFNSRDNDGWKAFITDGKRTQAEQDFLYEQGRTKPGEIVTWTKESKHVSGLAVDIAFQKDGKLSYAQTHYDKLVPIAKRLGFTWGGGWKQIDKPHFEKLKFVDIVGGEPIAQDLDIRLSILNENKIKSEGDLREVLGAYKELPALKEDKLNADKEIDRLRHLIEQDKLDLKAESDANSALKLAYEDHLQSIGKALDNGTDLPGILQAISMLVSGADRADKLEGQLRAVQNNNADLKADIARKEDASKSYSLKIDSLASELEQIREILSKWLNIANPTPEAVLGALRGRTERRKWPSVIGMVQFIYKLVKGFVYSRIHESKRIWVKK